MGIIVLVTEFCRNFDLYIEITGPLNYARQNLESTQNDMNDKFQKLWDQYETDERDVQLHCTRSLQKPISTCDWLEWLEFINYMHNQLLSQRALEFEIIRERVLNPKSPSTTPTSNLVQFSDYGNTTL